jgi:hypothetical protein
MEGDVFCFSPDIGRYVQRGGKAYSEHGRVYDLPGAMFRSMPSPHGSTPNYADWTDEERAAALSSARSAQEAAAASLAAQAAVRNALVESARQKLTPEEFDAVVNLGQDY